MQKKIFVGGGRKISLRDVARVANGNCGVRMAPEAKRRMNASRELLAGCVERHTPIYGLTTQFGNQANLLDQHIGGGNERGYRASLRVRQLRLIESHNCGLGEEMPEEVTRASMFLRAHCIGRGYSGVRTKTVESLVSFINHEVHPVIRRYGSIGASGDLIPLSAIASAVIGLDVPVFLGGKRMNAPSALKKIHLAPLVLEGREGLAFINGTSFSTAIAALALSNLVQLFPNLLATIGFTLESLQVMDSGYAPLVHALKNHRGEIEVNNFLRKLWRGSKLVRSLRALRKETIAENGHCPKESQKMLQDYYSLRSVSQGFGPFWENIERAVEWIEEEMNSVNDNPIIDARKKEIHHASNFMGHYVTAACDITKMDIAQASTWVHALIANLVHPRKNFGLPTNLIEHPENNNGFRPLQILSAAIAVQNRKLAQSQQSFMLPTEGDNQDVNSLSQHAAFDLRETVKNLERLTAILLLGAMQALDFRGMKLAGRRAKEAHVKIRKRISFISGDRMEEKDIENAVDILRTEKL